jgi:hypothetical protein
VEHGLLKSPGSDLLERLHISSVSRVTIFEGVFM